MQYHGARSLERKEGKGGNGMRKKEGKDRMGGKRGENLRPDEILDTPQQALGVSLFE